MSFIGTFIFRVSEITGVSTRVRREVLCLLKTCLIFQLCNFCLKVIFLLVDKPRVHLF